jgi:tetratricopeptide (TPR) repeat protein
MSRARAVLAEEFERAVTEGLWELACIAGLELAKTHMYASEPDLLSARAVLASLLDPSRNPDVRPEIGFDIRRFLYHVQPAQGPLVTVTAHELREEGASLGAINGALAELSIARRAGGDLASHETGLNSAQDIFSAHCYWAGAFEVAYKRATAALELQHYAKAERFYSAGAEYSDIGGLLHGTLMSVIGSFQCATAVGSDKDARNYAEILVRLCKSELGTGVAGLSVVAALQMLGDYERAAGLARKCGRFFRTRGLSHFESQAAFVEGACLAGTNDWLAARKAWERALKIDEMRGALFASCDRKAAVAQAIAMHEFSTTGKVSEHAISKVEALLGDSESELSGFPPTAEVIKSRGKLLQTHAQLCVMAQRPLDALRYLSRARDLYVTLGSSRDTALIDALSGLALLETAKTRSPHLFDEAAQALQRALDYFNDVQHLQIRWKLKYYLSIAAYLSSQVKSAEHEKEQWRGVAASWLQEAMKDSSLVTSGEASFHGSCVESDFSPGLKPEVMEPLKKALGLAPKAVQPRAEREGRVTVKVRRPSRQLH